MDKKKGFTLVELLAVLVILGILATITTVTINKTLKDSKNNLSNTQVNNIEESAKSYYITEGMSEDVNCINISDLISKGYIESKKILDPKTGKDMNGSVVLLHDNDQYIYEYRDYICTYFANGTPIYFDVSKGETCTEDEAVSTTGTKTGCMKFYAFNDKVENEVVNMILDHNTTERSKWIADGGVMRKGPTQVIDQLNADTKNWTGVEFQKNYTFSSKYDLSKPFTYTVSYTNFKARLITAQEVAQITGNNWDEGSSVDSYFFDSLTEERSSTCKSGNTTGCKYGWLYDRTFTDCKTYGCANNADAGTTVEGYWTATVVAKETDWSAWYIGKGSSISKARVSTNDRGVRPVITVKKSKLQ